MEEKKMDRRTLKTRKAICEGLAELLIEKEIRHITVQEIANKVDIHRVSFYKHFLDVYDVYEQLEKAMLDGLDEITKKYDEKSAYEFYPNLFQFIEEHPKIFKMVFSPNVTSKIRDKFYDVVGFIAVRPGLKN
jgi:AcrR family transcriptional regulator